MKNSIILMLIALICSTAVNGQRQVEKLDRGLVAIKTGEGVFLGWRILGEEWLDVSYNIYRNGAKVNDQPLDGPSNFVDNAGNGGDLYRVAAVREGIEQALSKEVTAKNNPYYDIPLNRPPGGTVPDGDFSYSPNDASIGDLDGDGDMEIILKWDPSNSHDNSHDGYTGEVIIDAYTLEGTQLWRINLGRNIRAGAHYTQFMVADFDGDGKAEMACKTADGTVDGVGTVIGDPDADYRNSSGRILSGPEFLTMFNGETGAAMHTIDYQPERGSVGNWGDTYGNRVDRFLACVAFLDGEHPSLVMTRGYYERTMLAAYDFKNGELSLRWLFNSEAGGLTAYSGQGNHNLSVADVDNDGKDEIIFGSMTLDDDGTGLYSTGLGHGDALHVSDLDPDHPGFEVFMPHESGSNGATFREAATGKILWQHKQSGDTGRGVSADISSNSRGFESWASGLGTYNTDGDVIGSRPNSTNFRVWWDKDLQSELLDGNTIRDYSTTIFSGSNVLSNNGTKSNPNLSADLFGDWREEVIWRYYDNERLRIFTTTEVTEHKIYTLLHDQVYRAAIAWQNVAYNQPPHAGFYMEADMALPVPLVFSGSKWKGSAGANTWDLATSNFEGPDGSPTIFNTGDTAIISMNGIHAEAINLSTDISPGLLLVASPDDYTISGDGRLAGGMNLYKTQKGSLKLTGSHTYTGKTIVTDGALIVDGMLEDSKVYVSGGAWGGKESSPDKGGRIGGSGHLNGGLVLQTRAALLPGMMETDTLFIENGLEIRRNALIYFDLSSSSVGSNDMVSVNGDLSFEDGITLKFNLIDGTIDTGNFVLFKYSGTLSGNIEDLELIGLEGFYYELIDDGEGIILRRPPSREPGFLNWKGDKSNLWALPGALNWELNNSESFFIPQDSVFFGESNVSQTDIEIQGSMNIGYLSINSSLDYTVSGTGSISGTGGITKKGSGTYKLQTENSFSGPIILEEGRLEISELKNGDLPSNLGTGGSHPSSLIINGGELMISADASSDKGLSIEGGGGILNIASNQEISGEIMGSGNLEKAGGGTLVISRSNPLSGDVTISGGTVKFLGDEANASGLGSGKISILNGTIEFFDSKNTYNSTNLHLHVPENGHATIIMDGRVFSNDRLTGDGDMSVYIKYVRSEFDGDWSEFNGNISIVSDIDGGDFRVNNSYGYAGSSMTFNENVYAYHLEDGSISIGNLFAKAGSVMRLATWEIGSRNEESILDGTIEGKSIIKKGTGRLIISGNNNIYSGGTEIEKGSLFVTNASGSATGTGPVNVLSDAILGGDGIIGGQVEVKTGALLTPGQNIGKLRVNNVLTMQPNSILSIEVSTGEKISDLLSANQIVLNDPLLYILNNSSQDYQNGDRFRILEADQINGSFSAIYPSKPGDGLAWDTTNLSEFGLIEIVESITGIEEESGTDMMNIYPNPSKGKVYVQSLENEGRISGISILNSTGVVVDRIETGKSKTTQEIDMTGYPTGIYMIRIQNEQNTISKLLFLINEQQ